MKTLLVLFVSAFAAFAQTNAWKTVTVGAIQGNLGLHTKCSINGQWVLVQGLSSDVVSAYQNYQKLDKEVKQASEWCDKEYKRIRTARANGPQEAPVGSPAGNYIRALNQSALALEEKQEALEVKMESLKAAIERFKVVSEIQAVETQQPTYSGMKLWVAKRN